MRGLSGRIPQVFSGFGEYKENNILYPAALQVIEEEGVWQRLKGACDAIGYCCFTPEA